MPPFFVPKIKNGDNIMASFGKRSLQRLNSCEPRLVEILKEAIEVYDFTILQGHRGEEEQQDFYERGLSKVQFPNSKHNKTPSMAVDIAPYPIDWEDTKRFFYLAGIITSIAHRKGYKIRWGGNWDMDYDFSDQKFNDLPHFEILDD